MSTTTFENLNEEKKQRIIHAGLEEFSKHSFNEASVTNIVKNADISRGSFYQYFKNKEKLYKYLLNYLYIKHRSDLMDLLISENGNLHRSLTMFFDSYLDEIVHSDYFSFYKNTFLYVSHYLLGNDGLFSLENQSKNREEQQKSFLEKINTDNLKVQSKEEVLEFIYLVVNVIHRTLIEEFNNNRSLEEIKEKSFRSVDWFCYGIQENY